MKKLISILLCLLLIGCTNNTASITSNKTNKLYILNFGDYINPELVEKFEKEENCIVVMDLFEANEEAVSILRKNSKYDLVCLSEYAIKDLVNDGLLEKINLIDAGLKRDIDLLNSIQDNISDYAIPYFKGSQGICYNKTKLNELGLKEPQSWDDLWNEEYKNEIVMPNNIRDLYTCALCKNGFSSNSTNKEEIEIATEDLIKQKGLVQSYKTDQIKENLVSGECLIAPLFSGDYQYVIDNSSSEFIYLIPSVLKQTFMDCWCIPKDSNRTYERTSMIYNFLCFLYNLDNYKINAEYVGYESCLEQVNSNDYTDVFDNTIDLSSGEELEDSLGSAIKLYTDGFNRIKAS